MAQTNWYAPSLTMKDELNLPQIAQQELATLLQRGQNARSVVAGPMAEVVQTSLQHWSDADIQAMLVYLQSLPQEEAVPPDFIDKMLDRKSVNKAEFDRMMEQGQTLYHDHCEACHNTDGSGKAGVYPALRASHTVQMKNIANAARIIYAGGFAPVTQGNPRPYGMPPFAPSLSDMEVALVLTYIRNAWGNQAGVVNANEVNPYRTASLE
jgi:mono/diheme cytochrome c family protein